MGETRAAGVEYPDDGMIWYRSRPIRRVRRVVRVFFVLGVLVPWALCGLAMLAVPAFYGYLWVRTGSWVETPARVTRVEWKVQKPEDGSEEEYQALAEYTYQINGHTHTGHRIGLLDLPRSSEKSERRRYELLKRHEDTGKPLAALVDPDNPDRALLFRQFPDHWPGFLVIGLGLLGVAYLIFRKTGRDAENRDDNALHIGPLDPTTQVPRHQAFLPVVVVGVLGVLFFGGVGLFITAEECLPQVTYWRTRNWVVWPVTLTQLEWRDGGKNDPQSYEFRAEYTYKVGGRTHTGDRINGLLRNTGWRELSRSQYELLLARKQTGRQATAFVDPRHPAHSILFREPPPFSVWELAFGAGMLFFGLPMAWLAVVYLRARSRQRRMLRQHGERWWLMRRDWERMQVRPCAVGTDVFAATMLLAIGGALSPAIVGVFQVPLGLMLLAAPLATAVLAVLALGGSIALRRIAFGIPVVHLREVPMLPGRTVEGTLLVRRRLDARSLHMRLVCRVAHPKGFKGPGEEQSRHYFVQFSAPVEPAGEVRVGPACGPPSRWRCTSPRDSLQRRASLP